MASLEMGVLKEQIHQKLKDDGVLSSLKAIVSSVLSSSCRGNRADDDALVRQPGGVLLPTLLAR